MTNDVLIDARDVTVRFDARAAVSGASLQVRRGELVGVVGASAAGKSVLLKALCGLEAADAGTIMVGGVDVRGCSRSELAALRRRIGFCFQNLALFDRIDVTANVAFALERRGVSVEEARTRAQAQLKAVGLEAACDKQPHELSGGMKRRLALARAMVANPEIALFDDPFVGLDPVACARIARLIAHAHARNGGVTLVAAGDPAPLFAVADRLVLVENGRLVIDQPARDFEQSSHDAVVRYLGRAA